MDGGKHKTGKSRRKIVNTKTNTGTPGKTGRHNLSKEKEAVAGQKDLSRD